MFQGFSIEVPFNLEVWIFFRLNSTFKMQRFSLPKGEFWSQWSGENWFGISGIWSWHSALIFWKICILSFFYLLQPSLALWVLSVEIDISLTWGRKMLTWQKNILNRLALLWRHTIHWKLLTDTSQSAWSLCLALIVGCLAHVNSRIFSICMIDVQRYISEVICWFESCSRWKWLAIHKPFCKTCIKQSQWDKHNYIK